MDILSWLHEFWWAVIAAVALGILSLIWKSGILWNRKLSRRWKATFTSQDGTKNEEDITIHCFAGLVRGHSTCTWKTTKSGEVKRINYKIRGRYKERTIVATYQDSDHTTVDMGVFIVTISPDGKFGNGIITSYDAPEDAEGFDFKDLDASEDYHWTRPN
jgi:hypothetical protein